MFRKNNREENTHEDELMNRLSGRESESDADNMSAAAAADAEATTTDVQVGQRNC